MNFKPTLIAAASLAAMTAPALAQPAPAANYDAPETWLCRPGRADLSHDHAARVGAPWRANAAARKSTKARTRAANCWPGG